MDLARDALEVALKEWSSGKSHGTLKDFKVPIEVIDTRWQTGKKLESYEILKEEPSEGPKVFAVKMKVAGEKQESEVKYYVIGKSPLFIYAEADYKKDTGM